MRLLLMCAGMASHSILPAGELPTIQTDRPDQTECPFLVPPGLLQMETGLSVESINEAATTVLAPATLLRYGVSDRIEARFAWAFESRGEGGGTNSGFVPASAGVKIHLADEHGLLPSAAFIGHLQLPGLASREFVSSFVAPSFRFAMQHTLTDRVILGYNLGAEWNGETPEPAFLYTVTAGLSINETIGCYAELYGFAPQHGTADHLANGGFTWLLAPNVMVDCSGGLGLASSPPTSFVAVGFSFRLME